MGEVQDYEAGIAKVQGYSFVKDVFSGNFCKKPEFRTKILAIASGTFMVYQLPATVLVDSVRFTLDQDGGLALSDDGGFTMDASETVHKQEIHSS